jgi:hypothetical protein
MATRQDLVDYMTANYGWSVLGVDDWLSGVAVGTQNDPRPLAEQSDWQALIDRQTEALAALTTAGKLISRQAYWTTIGRFRTE